ncbi:MAG: hypothetical protein DRJ40_09950 [Thermoprotei archaeon]|nr:MAG: hypothetical protein DRJ40_09950 [Thermoprotei archaeon]
MPIIIRLPIKVKEIKPITVSFVAEVPYLVPGELRVPEDVLKRFRDFGVPDGYPVQVCVAPLEYVIEKEGGVNLERPEVFGLPVAAVVYFRYGRGIWLSEYFWDFFSANFRKYVGHLKKGDPVKVRVVIHTALFIVDEDVRKTA